MGGHKGYSQLTASAACCSESDMAATLASRWARSAFSSASISGRAIVDSMMGRMVAYDAFTACTPTPLPLDASHSPHRSSGGMQVQLPPLRQHGWQDEHSLHSLPALMPAALPHTAHSACFQRALCRDTERLSEREHYSRVLRGTAVKSQCNVLAASSLHLGVYSVVVQQRSQLLREAVHLNIHDAKFVQRVPPVHTQEPLRSHCSHRCQQGIGHSAKGAARTLARSCGHAFGRQRISESYI